MDLIKDIKNIYFLGIGGIGMSALARWFKAQGFEVGGYDKTKSPLTEQLIAEGMDIHYDDQAGRIPTLFYRKAQTLVVFTPAVPKNNVEYRYFESAEYQMLKRAQVLGLITEHHRTVAIAGTHGKTTTTTLTAHIFKTADIECSAFMGGISANYGTNLLIGSKDAPVIVEADEYDRSFLTLRPEVAVVTSTDADHLDIYGSHDSVLESFNTFGNLVSKSLIAQHKTGMHAKHLTYALDAKADYFSDNIRISKGKFIFDFHGKGQLEIKDIALAVPGYHNVENATAAMAAALEYGLPVDKLKQAIESFKGVKRRFEYIVDAAEIVYIDDYAHHPAELHALLTSAKSLFAGKKVTIVFQPHLYSRTRDFYKEFAMSLDLADEVLLLDIYPARELPIDGISAEIIKEHMQNKNVQILSKEGLLAHIEAHLNTDVLLTAGAGDIDRYVEQIAALLKTKYIN
ncbi:MAG TPA: UDP-N-acetylmuramate--L-alanine ligase [Cytophagales bacterium]|nr:UDP-N-acetylmuramate--L-alanine ligase [Cytophagales bacterium]